MKSKDASFTLCLHAGLLLLACTRFTVTSWIWGDASWSFNFFQYGYADGWGYVYQSDYSLGVVLAYLAAYMAGAVGYGLAWKYLANGWTIIGLLVSAVGAASFGLEATHWMWDHHLSVIAIAPVVSLILAVVVLVQLQRVDRKPGLPVAASPIVAAG